MGCQWAAPISTLFWGLPGKMPIRDGWGYPIPVPISIGKNSNGHNGMGCQWALPISTLFWGLPGKMPIQMDGVTPSPCPFRSEKICHPLFFFRNSEGVLELLQNSHIFVCLLFYMFVCIVLYVCLFFICIVCFFVCSGCFLYVCLFLFICPWMGWTATSSPCSFRSEKICHPLFF